MTINLGSIDIPDDEVAAAQHILDQQNTANGTSLTMAQLIRGRIREVFQGLKRHRDRQTRLSDYSAITQELQSMTEEQREKAIEAMRQAAKS